MLQGAPAEHQKMLHCCLGSWLILCVSVHFGVAREQIGESAPREMTLPAFDKSSLHELWRFAAAYVLILIRVSSREKIVFCDTGLVLRQNI